MRNSSLRASMQQDATVVASTVTKIVNKGRCATALPRPWKALAETLGFGSIALCVFGTGCVQPGTGDDWLMPGQNLVAQASHAAIHSAAQSGNFTTHSCSDSVLCCADASMECMGAVLVHFTNTALIRDLLNKFSLAAAQTCAFRYAGRDGACGLQWFDLLIMVHACVCVYTVGWGDLCLWKLAGHNQNAAGPDIVLTKPRFSRPCVRDHFAAHALSLTRNDCCDSPCGQRWWWLMTVCPCLQHDSRAKIVLVKLCALSHGLQAAAAEAVGRRAAVASGRRQRQDAFAARARTAAFTGRRCAEPISLKNQH